MNPFNKYEAVGIFFSIAIMVLALAVIRFKGEIVALNSAVTSVEQGAVVAISQNGDNPNEIRDTLIDASTADGTLVNLVIDDITVGSGSEVKVGDTVTVHYIGTTQSGLKFDSSYERGEPFTFTVGDGKVIIGWEKGLVGMKVGGKRILVIPSDMAYGNRQVGTIPPNSVLVFSVELLNIK